MAALSIRDLGDDVKERLRVRAAQNGRSMEAEAREILGAAVLGPADEEKGLFITLMERIDELGGVDLDIPPRSAARPAPTFDA